MWSSIHRVRRGDVQLLMNVMVRFWTCRRGSYTVNLVVPIKEPCHGHLDSLPKLPDPRTVHRVSGTNQMARRTRLHVQPRFKGSSQQHYVLKGVLRPRFHWTIDWRGRRGPDRGGSLISPIPRESEATEGRGRQEIPELLRTQRKVEVRFSDVRDLPGFPPGFSNRGSCGGGC